ncbi:hypothetical protein D1BOALGB6SA_8326 [Olavius sp. associated proteobacterium Delta 1]|nr:hypothetical protein D1BOALGB6SA_8326 [Olavius sp. associated proteobacterium Delta 1]
MEGVSLLFRVIQMLKNFIGQRAAYLPANKNPRVSRAGYCQHLKYY